MRITGVKPVRLTAQEPKTCVSVNSTIPASYTGSVKVERREGFEPPNNGFADRSIRPLWHLLIRKRGTLPSKILALFYVNYCIQVFYAGLIGCFPNDVDPKNSRRVPTFFPIRTSFRLRRILSNHRTVTLVLCIFSLKHIGFEPMTQVFNLLRLSYGLSN